MQQLTWATAVAWAEKELVRLRSKLEGVDLDPAQTNVVRGEIAALKRLIALPTTAAREASMAAQQ